MRETPQSFLLASILAATMSLSGACKRQSPSPTASEATATAPAVDDVPSGCWETNPPAAKAAACMACLARNKIKSPAEDGCCGIHDQIGLQLCQAVSACVRGGGPPVGICNVDGDTTTCYCGKHQAGCDLPGQADGPCIAQITAAAGRNTETRTTDTPNAAQIMERYGLVQYALGRAMNVAGIAGALCKAECGL